MNDPEEIHYIVCIFGHEIRQRSNVNCLLMAVLFLIFLRFLFLRDTPRRQSKSLIVN